MLETWSAGGTPIRIPHHLQSRYERLGFWDCQYTRERRSLGKQQARRKFAMLEETTGKLEP